MTRALVTLLLCFCLAGIATAITLISVEQEIEIGRTANADVRKQTPQFRDRQTEEYVRRIAGRLVKVAPGPKYPYSFTVANYREINAFALPGGPVWINRGVLHLAGNESQLAGVLAHEIAHVARRHAAEQLTNALVTKWGVGVLGALLGNAGGATTAQAAANVVAGGMFMKFSRDDERDADRVGLQMLTRAGWDGRGMVELFETLAREQKRNPGMVETFFSSHPSPQDRVRALAADVARRRGGRRDSQEFRTLKARLLRMSPPATMNKK